MKPTLTQKVPAYRINIYKAYRMDEVGTHYSWEEWGEDTDYYGAEEDEIEVLIPAEAALAESKTGEVFMYYQGQAYDLHEALARGLAKVLTLK